MEFLEKNLEEIIYRHHFRMGERGLHIFGNIMLRQVNFPGYGIADLIAIKYDVDTPKTIHFEIIELKKDLIDATALMQACRYETAIQHLLRFKYPKLIYTTKITLIGKKIESKGDFVFLLNNCTNVNVYTYDYSFDGIKFIKDTKNWVIVDADFRTGSILGSINEVRDGIKEINSIAKFYREEEEAAK
jgi:hypothetical protein